jgi:hypothetical protein
MINSPISAPWSEQLVHVLALESTYSHPYNTPNPQINEPDYDLIPQSAMAIQVDKKLEMVHDWLTFLE